MVELVRRASPKINPLRDRHYLDWVRTQPCIVTGHRGIDVDPAHIGTLGKGVKSPDDEVLPLSNALHREAHQTGEMSWLRANLPNGVLRLALRAYAREMYQQYLYAREMYQQYLKEKDGG